jgi:hypothetical protein
MLSLSTIAGEIVERNKGIERGISEPVQITPLFAPFIYKMHHFTKTGSGQT